MGFLSRYVLTERLDLGDGFWLDYRPYLSSAQKARAEDLMVTSGTGDGMRVASGSFAFEIVVQSITGWNLTDENDIPLPVRTEDERRASLARCPGFVVDKVFAKVNETSANRQKDEAAFPGGAGPDTVGGDATGGDPVAAG